MDIKLIATDMDDTLLDDSSKLSEKNIESIVNVQKKGVKFVLASGRAKTAMINFAEILKMHEFDGYLITSNGGSIVDCKSKKEIYIEYIDESSVIEMFEIAKKFNTSFAMYIDDIIYIYNMNEFSKREPEIVKLPYEIISNIDNFDLKKVTKCLIFDNEENIKRIYTKVNERLKEKSYIVLPKPYIVEIGNFNVNKGTTLKKLIDILKIDASNVIASGDSYNDYEMLNTVGIPVAVDNAVDELKKIAKYISVDNNNSALSDIIEKFIGD